MDSLAIELGGVISLQNPPSQSLPRQGEGISSGARTKDTPSPSMGEGRGGGGKESRPF
jgi:hypothetical protein